MKKTLFALILGAAVSGCVINRPLLVERTTSTNGIVTERTLKVTSVALWPATQSLDRQNVSAGKTLSVGQRAIEQETGGTNVVQALQSIERIVGSLR